MHAVGVQRARELARLGGAAEHEDHAGLCMRKRAIADGPDDRHGRRRDRLARAMRRLLVIGVGAGDPEHVTMQAINALNEVDVFFVIEKGHETDELVRLRREICERYIREPAYRIVEIADPPRDRTTPAYRMAVEDWRARRAELWERAIADELDEEGCGAFLVWGDPSLYDSTLAVLEQILERGAVAFEHEVVPGISSVQALTARHRIPLNRVGRAGADHDRPIARGGLPRRASTKSW